MSRRLDFSGDDDDDDDDDGEIPIVAATSPKVVNQVELPNISSYIQRLVNRLLSEIDMNGDADAVPADYVFVNQQEADAHLILQWDAFELRMAKNSANLLGRVKKSEVLELYL
jgi:hypothetical protein